MRDPGFFLNRYAPTTTHIAFLDESPHKLADFIYAREVDLNSQYEFPTQVQRSEVEADLDTKLELLLPLTSMNDRTLICKTESNWSAYITNGINGGDVHSQPHYLASILKVRSVGIIMVADVPGGQPGSMQFVYRDGTQTKEIMTRHGPYAEMPSRSIAAHKESRWEFHAHGEPLPFEDVDRYSAKKIKDRLTTEMIEQYCAALGIHIFDPSFFAGYGCMIKSHCPPNARVLEKFPNL